MKPLTDAYDGGLRRAFKLGTEARDIHKNPYSNISKAQLHEAWNQGFNAKNADASRDVVDILKQ